MSGWIKIHKRIQDWEWYKDGNTVRVFLHLLLNANYEKSEWRGHEIFPGSYPTGRKALAYELGLSEQQIRTSLNHLMATNSITIKSTKHFSIISIVKWSDYQSNQPAEQPQHQPAKQPHLKKKEVKKKEIFIINKPQSVSDGVWNDFCLIRKTRKADVTETVIKNITAEAESIGWSLDKALSEACARGWQSFKADWINKKGTQNETNSRNPAKPSKLERAENALNRGIAAYQAQLQHGNGMAAPALPPARPVIPDFQRVREGTGSAGSDLSGVCEDFEPIPD